MTPISPEAREAAENFAQELWSDKDHLNLWFSKAEFSEHVSQFAQREREKIIRECAEHLITVFPPITLEEAKDGVFWQRDVTVKMKDSILAKLNQPQPESKEG